MPPPPDMSIWLRSDFANTAWVLMALGQKEKLHNVVLDLFLWSPKGDTSIRTVRQSWAQAFVS